MTATGVFVDMHPTKLLAALTLSTVRNPSVVMVTFFAENVTALPVWSNGIPPRFPVTPTRSG